MRVYNTCPFVDFCVLTDDGRTVTLTGDPDTVGTCNVDFPTEGFNEIVQRCDVAC